MLSKSMFSYGMRPQLMAMIIESETELVDTGVMALAINLSLCEPIAERICFAGGQDPTGRGLKMLLKRAFKRKDVLLLKLIRNIAYQKRAEIKMLFVVRCALSSRYSLLHSIWIHMRVPKILNGCRSHSGLPARLGPSGREQRGQLRLRLPARVSRFAPVSPLVCAFVRSAFSCKVFSNF